LGTTDEELPEEAVARKEGVRFQVEVV